ncbi:MAG: hypothetical protein N4A49_03525 [Marinifilaceae bacterium]|jgi:hypothetical protein|nr:hypothetical protein [Marinifilaceae bacterium]
MKRFNIYICAIIATISLFSCTNEETFTHKDNTVLQSKVYTIKSGDWQGETETGKWAKISIPEINENVFEYGAVLAYIHTLDNKGKQITRKWEPLSYTLPNSMDNNDTGDMVEWKERIINYTVEEGAVYIEAKSPNGTNALDFNEDLEIKVDILSNSPLK